MAVDVSRLSPKAQQQVYGKLLELQKNRSGATFDGGEGNLTSQKKIAQSGSKYGNKKVVVDGIQFDSKKEARRYLDLKTMEIAGQIRDLQLQVPFELIPSQRIDGKVVERSCDYVADFTYRDQDGRFVVEDTKGHRTKDYIIKRKLMLHIHGIQIREV